MPEKDITEKTLESYEDVFADIANVLLFHGSPVIKENELEDAVVRSHYKADGGIHEMERDVAKYWKNGNIHIAFAGYENQSVPDPDMPLRNFGYDGAAYRAQLLADEETIIDPATGESVRKKKRKPRYPVITLVLYFNYKHLWDKPLSLRECLENVPPELEPFIPNYKIHLYDIAGLSEEQLGMFQSDFKIIADYFVQMRKNRTYTPSRETITHVHATLELMSVMTNDRRFLDAYRYPEGKGSEPETMCEVLDIIEEKGEAIGMKKGEAKGQRLIITLNNILINADRIDDLKRASKDEAYLNQLLDELIPGWRE